MSDLLEATPCESFQHRVDQCSVDLIRRELGKDVLEAIVKNALKLIDSYETFSNGDENKRVNDTNLESSRATKKIKRYDEAEPEMWSKSRETDAEYYALYKTTFLQMTNCLNLVLSTPKELGINVSSLDNTLENSLSGSNISNVAIFSDTEDTSISETFSRTNSVLSNESSRSLKVNKKRNKFAKLTAQHQISLCQECAQSDDTIEENSDVICRFNGWRKLVYDRNTDKISETGFLELTDATIEDYSLWEARIIPEAVPVEIKENELKIISFIGDIFEQLVNYENRFRNKVEKKLTWKRTLLNTRELCDTCCTTIFNGHFCCTKCGYSVCLNCYESRLDGVPLEEQSSKKKDMFDWHFCSAYEIVNSKFKAVPKRRHSPEELLYVQYIPPYILNSTYEEYKKILSKHASELQELKSRVDFCQNNDNQVGEWFGKQDKCHQFMVLDANVGKDSDYMFDMFDMEWANKRPVLVRNLHQNFDANLWTPQSFLEDFENLKVDLINCRNHKVVPNVPITWFWKGFESVSDRMTDDKLRPLILKLKDWPTSDDFKQILPSRFNDLMNNAPVPEYTIRQGQFNLVERLPEFFGKPDLGPKMYIAYGSMGNLTSFDQEGTTNLHVDIADAFNILMYVGDYNRMYESDEATLLKKEDRCFEKLVSSFEKQQSDRFRVNGERPGAIWHLFRPQDADKIREFLIMYNTKYGKKKEPKNNTDPIHDQVSYINSSMLDILHAEYGVEVFSILQYQGDAIFIPAGAPHQVRNLNSCIKVAGDFVSPQGVDQCILMTDQFRKLSDFHINHEDKLQIKNIIYHRIKDSVAVLKDKSVV